MALLSVHNAELYYDHVYALKGVSIEVNEGETVNPGDTIIVIREG